MVPIQRRMTCFAAALSLLLTAVPMFAQEAPQGPPPAKVRVGKVDQQTLRSRMPLVGRLRETRRSVLAAEQEGKIVEVSVEEGDVVEGGQTVVARIDDVFLKMDLEQSRASLAQARAEVAEARALLDQAQRDRRQLEELLAAGSAKPREVADARAQEEAAQARLQAAEASVATYLIDIRRSEEAIQKLAVVAPFDGVVVRKMVEVGQWASPGTGVVEIVSAGNIEAVVDVPESLVSSVQVGDEVEVRIESLQRDVVGKVTAVVPLSETPARTFPVKIELDDMDGQLKSGMSVVARVPTTEAQQVFTVPRDAVLRGAQGSVVWVDGGGQAFPVAVRILFGAGDRYAVEALPGGMGPGLAPGMNVVIEGAERLFPTQPLQIVNEPAQARS